MRRREFITLLGGTALTWPLAARAQQPAKLPSIGYLGPNTRAFEVHRLGALVQRLRELGWIEGRTILIDYRWADGRNERLPEIMAEFVKLKVDVIVTAATPPLSRQRKRRRSFRSCSRLWETRSVRAWLLPCHGPAVM
jgi:putative ABC transport system substrate-binding protein